MLTAHAATAESLKKSIGLGAAAFLPHDPVNDLEEVIEDILLGYDKHLWWRKTWAGNHVISTINSDRTGKNWMFFLRILRNPFRIIIEEGNIMNSEKFTFWFEELGKEHNNIVGKKCANLGEMIRLELPVPPGFALSIDLYRKFIRETGAGKEISRYAEGLGNLKAGGITLFEEISQRIQGIIESRKMPTEIEDAISSCYEELSEKVGIPDMAVSVRSAGTESRPGMFETYLNVIGVDDVLEKVKKVWASVYTTRAVAFRINNNIPVISDELGIAIPKMVNARASGIAFTVDPVWGDDSKIILEANWGLGEGVVSGAESVDGFVVNKEDLEITKRQVGNKIKCVVRMGKGTKWAAVPGNIRKMPCVSDEEILEISRIAKAVEKKLKCAQDMEWAIDQDLPFPKNIFWLQTRPAKVRAKKPQSTTDQIIDLIAKRFEH